MNEPEQVIPALPDNVSVVVHITQAVRDSILNVGSAVALAETYVIDSNDMAQIAQEEIKTFAQQITNIEKMRDDLMVEPKNTLEKIKGWFNPSIADKTNAITLLKQRVGGWLTAERNRIALENKQREEESRKARQEAEAKARAEIARAEEQAAEKRRQAEAAEVARRNAEAEGNARAAAAAAAQAAKLREQAESAIENGAARATEVQLEAAARSTVVAPVEQAKISGIQMRDNWVAEFEPNITEDQATALIAAECGTRPELLSLLKLDASAANKLAKAQHNAMRVPGMRAVNRQIVAAARK